MRTNYKSILKRFFGKKWDQYEIIPETLGYFVYHKEDEFDEYFILKERNGGVAPYYLCDKYWCKHDDAPAYVIQSEPGELLVPCEGANAYYYNEIKERFQEAGVEDPDMDFIEDLLNGQSIDQLIEDYKNKYWEGEDE